MAWPCAAAKLPSRSDKIPASAMVRAMMRRPANSVKQARRDRMKRTLLVAAVRRRARRRRPRSSLDAVEPKLDRASVARAGRDEHAAIQPLVSARRNEER